MHCRCLTAFGECEEEKCYYGLSLDGIIRAFNEMCMTKCKYILQVDGESEPEKSHGLLDKLWSFVS